MKRPIYMDDLSEGEVCALYSQLLETAEFERDLRRENGSGDVSCSGNERTGDKR